MFLMRRYVTKYLETIILRSMRWVRHVACMREKRKACSILVENREGRGYSE